MRKRFFHYVLISAGLSLVVFIFSFLNNTFLTSLVRAVYGFIFFIIVILPAHWFMRRVSIGVDATNLTTTNTGEKEQPVGHHIDLITPEEGISLHPNEKDKEFIPWVMGQENADRDENAKKIAQSLNLFSDDKGR